MSNYPPGAEHDPNAPWNQGEPPVWEGEYDINYGKSEDRLDFDVVLTDSGGGTCTFDSFDLLSTLDAEEFEEFEKFAEANTLELDKRFTELVTLYVETYDPEFDNHPNPEEERWAAMEDRLDEIRDEGI